MEQHDNEQFVLNLVANNPGITVRQMHMCHSWIKPWINPVVQRLVRNGKLRAEAGAVRRNTKYYVVYKDKESEGIAALRAERERYDRSVEQMSELRDETFTLLQTMMGESEPGVVDNLLIKFTDMVRSYAAASKFVKSREEIFG